MNEFFYKNYSKKQFCFQLGLHPMMTLGSGMFSGPKHHYH